MAKSQMTSTSEKSRTYKPKTTVYVDIPPSPHRSKPTPPAANRRLTAAYVHIPHSPLWRSNSSVTASSVKSKKMSLSTVTPAAPLVDRVNLKRKSPDQQEKDASNKKPRLAQPKVPAVPKKKALPKPVDTKAIVPAAPKPIVRRPRKVITPDAPRWRLIQDAGSRQAVLDRMQLKEFFTRFAQLLNIGRSHLNALDEITSSLPDAAIKAFLVALVDLLAADATKDHLRESLLEAKGALKKGKLSLSDLWSILSDLKAEAPILKIAEPTPKEPDAPSRRSFSPPAKRTRSTRASNSSNTVDDSDNDSDHPSSSRIHIDNTDQLIPVILSLIDYTFESSNPSIKADLDLGVTKKTKYRNQLVEKQKADNDLWTEEKKRLNEEKQAGLKEEKALLEKLQAKFKPSGGSAVVLQDEEKFDIKGWKAEFKAADDKHKAKLKIHNVRFHQQISGCNLRHEPKIGMDYDGREYYLLSLPTNGTKPPKVPSLEPDSSSTLRNSDDEGDDEVEMKKWSWGLAVWKAGKADDEDEEPGQWYGFTEADEIRKLVKWLEWRKAEHDKLETEKNNATGDLSTNTAISSARSSGFKSLTSSISISTSRTSMTSMDLDQDEDDDEDEVDDLLANQVRRPRVSRVHAAAALFNRDAVLAEAPQGCQVDIKSLCKQLGNFADFLDWKLKKD